MDNGEYCTKQDRDKIIERQADEIEIYEEANINAFKTIENITQQVEKYKREIETKDIIIKNKDKKLDNYKKAILEQNVAIQKRDKKIENLKMESGMRNGYEKVVIERGLDTKKSIEERDKIIERQADEIEILNKANINALKTIENITQQVEKHKKEIEIKDLVIKTEDKKYSDYKKVVLEKDLAFQKKDKRKDKLNKANVNAFRTIDNVPDNLG